MHKAESKDYGLDGGHGTSSHLYRYDTLKKTTIRADRILPQLDRLRHAVEEYEQDRWRIISGKVGNGFSANACRDKIAELNGEPVERSEDDEMEEREGLRSRDGDLHLPIHTMRAPLVEQQDLG